MSTRRPAKKKPVEHRYPTQATVRQLYGTAHACAKPGCGEPLFRLNDGATARVLNSHVAHIHARSEGGPRWDPDMSGADNRAAENLLLLCLAHATEIDAIPDQYPAELLREWKRQQLADADQIVRNWRITNAEAREALAPLDLQAAIDRVAAVVPFNPRMRSRTEAWQRAVQRASGRRMARLTPLVPPGKRDAVLTWMATDDEPITVVPPGTVRVLVARMGAGKSEQADRWLEEGLRRAAATEEAEIGAWFDARTIRGSLEPAVIDELGAEPTRACRVVIDGLDGVSPNDAARLLAEARALVHVWPSVSVLATAPPGLVLAEDETIVVQPWPIERGAALLRAVIGDHYWPNWNGETLDLLKSPMTSLALGSRLLAGQSTTVSRLEVLAGLGKTVIDSRSHKIADETWNDLARLAVEVLSQAAPASSSSFATLPRVRRLLATDMVIEDGNALAFSLPIFELYFGSEAIRAGLVALDEVAAGDTFPNWRYALAFAVSTATPAEQEKLMLAIAQANPAAAFWILNEIGEAPSGGQSVKGADHAAIARILSRGGSITKDDEPNLAVSAGLWLREAEEALLTGVGPLADSVAQRRGGQLTQWGVWLQSGYLTLARARDRVPPPAVVQLDEVHPEITLAAGWKGWTQLRFPTNHFGRWTHAQRTLQEEIERLMTRRTLRVPADSWLARERAYHLSEFVYDFGVGRRRRPIALSDLREKVNAWVDQANASQWSRWGSGKVDSADVWWLASQLALETGERLERPWPGGDRPCAGRWVWESYSPELTLAIATDVVRKALVGYRQLVDTNFPKFGRAMGLYSMLPLRVEGIVDRPEDNPNDFSVHIVLMLHSDPAQQHLDAPQVDLTLATDADRVGIWDRGREHALHAPRTRFGQDPVQEVELELHVGRAATNLAYKWLADDLVALGWLRDRIRFFD